MSIYERFEKYADKTFDDAVDRYLDEFKGKDLKRQALALESTAKYIGETPLIDVDDAALKQYKLDRVNGTGQFDRPAMAGTVNKELTCAVTVLNKACRVWRWIPSAPKFEHVDGDVRKAYPLTWEEQDRLFVALPTLWECVAALFAVNTGVRKSELFGLKWTDRRDIPSLNTYVFILRNTKNGKDRAVICNWLARKAVSHMEKVRCSEYVFPAELIRQSGKIWAQAWVRAGLPNDPLTRRGIHNLRHTAGARLRAADVPDEERAFLLGHNNASLVQHYALPDIERLAAYAERITVRRETVMLR